MPRPSAVTSSPPLSSGRRRRRRDHARELLRQTLGRQVLFYYLPLLLLAAFFNLQYWRFDADSRRAHLSVIAEQQATTLDLFLRERLVNLANLIDDEAFVTGCCTERYLGRALERLRQSSDTFVDLGVVASRRGRH